MIRQLIEEDFVQVERLINENSTFQGREMPETTRARLIRDAKERISYYPDTKPYYGNFDKDEFLLALVRFELWDIRDKPNTCTMGLTCTTNTRSLDREPGSRWSTPILDVTNYGFEQMLEKGVTTGYATRTSNKNWVGMDKDFMHSDKLNYELVEEVSAGKLPIDPLHKKYVLWVPYRTDQLIVKFTRKI